MITLIIYVVIGIIVLAFLSYALKYLPPPLSSYGTLILLAIGVIFLIWLLLAFARGAPL